VKRLALTIADIWRLAVPYFRSDDRWPGRVLLGAVIAIELALVGLQVILNQWYNRFYNTLQDRNWDAFISAILFFCVLAAIYTVLVVYKLYLNQWLQIRWRRWMTQTYLHEWLTSANHYRMQLLGDEADNPDQRIDGVSFVRVFGFEMGGKGPLRISDRLILDPQRTGANRLHERSGIRRELLCPSQQVRQLGYVHSDPPRLFARQPLR